MPTTTEDLAAQAARISLTVPQYLALTSASADGARPVRVGATATLRSLVRLGLIDGATGCRTALGRAFKGL